MVVTEVGVNVDLVHGRSYMAPVCCCWFMGDLETSCILFHQTILVAWQSVMFVSSVSQRINVANHSWFRLHSNAFICVGFCRRRTTGLH